MRKIKCLIKYAIKKFNVLKKKHKANWLDNHEPYSRIFGLDRGTAIDRFFIEDFLNKNSNLIIGNILEFGDDRYISKYATKINNSIVFGGKGQNIITKSFNIDLTNLSELNSYLNYFDCIIATNVLNFIFDFDTAIKNLSKIIKADTGTCLITVSGLTSISKFDYERWGDYWRFNDLSMALIFKKYFSNVDIDFYGNSKLAAAFILGLSKEEIPYNLFQKKDHEYQITIVIKASNPI